MGRTPLIKLVVCRQDGWPGRGTRSNKVGDTCKVHCAGVRFENTNMNGTIYDCIVLKKMHMASLLLRHEAVWQPTRCPLVQHVNVNIRRDWCAQLSPSVVIAYI